MNVSTEVAGPDSVGDARATARRHRSRASSGTHLPQAMDASSALKGIARIAPQLARLAVSIDSISLHPRNPRVGNVAAVAASLGRFGQQKPVVVQASTRHVVAGNHLLQAARSLGWTTIAASIEDLDDADALAFMLADNRTADLGGYDEQLLAAILAENAVADNLAATGYDADDVAALLAAAGLTRNEDPDAVPDRPAPDDLYVELGQTWQLGRHRLAIGDSTAPRDVDRLTAAASVDLIWTDPPYGVAYRGKNERRLTIVNDDLGPDGTRALVADALRLAPLRPGGAFYITAPAGPLLASFLQGVAETELTLRQTLVWDKGSIVLGHSDYQYRHEVILYGWRPGAAHRFVADRTAESVWQVARPARNPDHPTTKPVELVSRAIRNSTRPGETILDPFVGSGTTLIAAEATDRTCLGMELDPVYGQVAIERWQAFSGLRATRLA
jgi:DNA modification methylase